MDLTAAFLAFIKGLDFTEVYTLYFTVTLTVFLTPSAAKM